MIYYSLSIINNRFARDIYKEYAVRKGHGIGRDIFFQFLYWPLEGFVFLLVPDGFHFVVYYILKV